MSKQLESNGKELIRAELRAHGLEHEMHLLDDVVPRLRRHPRLETAFKNSCDVKRHFKCIAQRPVTDVELLVLLLYTGTDAQGQIRKYLRTPDGGETERND